MRIIPFIHEYQLNCDLDDPSTVPCFLPGNPRIKLNDRTRMSSFIHKEFDLGDFDDLAHRLWLMSKQDSGNISPLHRQYVKGRRIVITEDIRLHLVWHYDRIFIKPLPSYLTSYTFWAQYLTPNNTLAIDKEKVLKSALGYLRTYTHLIQHESDFHIAQEQRLIPASTTFPQLSAFLSRLESITDAEVASRFHYGEIRLSRLNFYSKILLGKFYFQRVHGQYGSYFATFYAPLLYLFGTLSLLLNAMQLAMSVEQVYVGEQWVRFWGVCREFSLLCMVVGFVISVVLAGLFLYKFVKEWIYAIKQRRLRLKKEVGCKA